MKVRNDALTLPAWQLLEPQVAARLAGLTDERGSLAGRLWCGVWQSEHIAADWWPTPVALPWKLSWNDL